MTRVRIPCKEEKHRNLLLTEDFNSDKALRKAVKKEVQHRWPDFWKKIKDDFKFTITEP